MNAYKGEQPLVHQFETVKPAGNSKMIIGAVFIILVGIVSGFALHKLSRKNQTVTSKRYGSWGERRRGRAAGS